jgi:hypothetical protein
MSNPPNVRVEEKRPRALLLAALADVNPQTAVRFLAGLPVMRKPLEALTVALPEARRIRPQWYPERAS